MNLADQPQSNKALLQSVAEARNQLLEKRIAGNNEFCVLCLQDMGFQKSHSIHHPKRYENGATYVEGAGQCCSYCSNNQSSGI